MARADTSGRKGNRKRVVSSGSYNPDQDLSERRSIRREYRTLIKNTVESKRTLARPGDHTLSQTLALANEVYTRVRMPNEAVLDSELLVMSGELARQKASRIKLGPSVEFDVDEYIGRLRSYLYGDDDIREPLNVENDKSDDEDDVFDASDIQGWKKLGKLATSLCARPSLHEFLAIEPTPRAPRELRRTQQTSRFAPSRLDIVRPQEFDQSNIVRQENNTSSSVVYIGALLKEIGRPVNLFEFILNPQSFSQSVENLFYLSFLVRDGHAYIDEDHNGVPIVGAVSPPDLSTTEGQEEMERRRNLTRNQAIFELSMSAWSGLIDAFEIKESIIPTREMSRTRSADAINKNVWYG
ncbi:Nse4 C-terminal-domain-containing protein [Dipodascopsis uninucleata]